MTFFVSLYRCVFRHSWSALAACWFTGPALLLNFGASAEAANTFSLIKSGSTEVFSGVPFEVEIRADLDIPVSAVAFTLTAAGDSTLSMDARSAAPMDSNSLLFISDTSMDPFESGLPRMMEHENATPEVLLHTGVFPYEGIGPGADLLVEALNLSASGAGILTIRLEDVQAASTLWIGDGTMVADIAVDPAELTLTVLEPMVGDLDVDADVDGLDLLLFVRCMKGDIPASDPVYDRADLDDDGDIDERDVFTFGSRFGAGMGTQSSGKGSPDIVTRMGGAEPGGEERLTEWAKALSIETSAVAAVEPDADGDGRINEKDLVYVRARLGQDPSQGADLLSADVNEDGSIDLVDLVTVRNRFGSTKSYYYNLRISELVPSSTPGEPSWMEIMNYGIRAVSIQSDFQIFNDAGFVFSLGSSLSAFPGMPIQIVFDGYAETEYFGEYPYWDAIRFHATPNGPDPFPAPGGRCALMQRLAGPEFVAQDEIEWGTGEARRNYFNFVDQPLPAGGSVGRDGYETERWVRYPEASPLEANLPLTPVPMHPAPGGLVFSATTTQFFWADPRYAAMAYRLQVSTTNSFESPIVNEIAVGMLHDVSPALSAGDYVWRVRAEAGEFVSPWSATAAFTAVPFPEEILSPGGGGKVAGPNSPTQSTTNMIDKYKINGFLPQAAKDSHMVCLECWTDEAPHAWDAPHQVGNLSTMCEHDTEYGIYAGIVSIVKHYDGAMLQDQLAYHLHGSQDSGISPEGDLGHAETISSSQARDLLAWALGGSNTVTEQHLASPGTAVWDIIKGYIDNDIPILVTNLLTSEGFGSVPGLVLVGYQEEVVQSVTNRRLLFQAPWLTSNLRLRPMDWGRISSADLIIPVPSNISLQPVDVSVWDEDGDKDKLVDVDEELRFGTSSTKEDTDGDGVNDKKEVWSYVFGLGIVPRKADIDGDGLRAERDEDSDGDVCIDGFEDENGNGNYVLIPGFKFPRINLDGGRLKEKDETDPFWDDEYNVTVRTEVDEIGYNRTANFFVEALDVDYYPVRKKTLLIDVLPESMGFVGNPRPVTDENGKTTVQFRADHQTGAATVRAILDPCRFSRTEPKGVDSEAIRVIPVDYVFIIQDEARLTGDEELDLPPIQDPPDRCYVIHSRQKFGGQQTVRGHFFHPEFPDIGKYINTIRTGSPKTHATLIIDGTPMENNAWIRKSTEEIPRTWEIRLDTTPPWQQYPFPRNLIVSTNDGVQVSAPLVWWNVVWSSANATRDFVWNSTLDSYTVKSYQHVSASAWFFFGDGDEDGMDETWWLWPDQTHTSVSFYPTGSVTGIGNTFQAPYWDQVGWWSSRWWEEFGAVAHQYDVFRWHKSECSFIPPFSWDVRQVSVPDDLDIYEVLIPELNELLPFDIPPLIEHVQYKRDYIEDEAEFLAKRSLEPPDITIDMYSSEVPQN